MSWAISTVVVKTVAEAKAKVEEQATAEGVRIPAAHKALLLAAIDAVGEPAQDRFLTASGWGHDGDVAQGTLNSLSITVQHAIA